MKKQTTTLGSKPLTLGLFVLSLSLLGCKNNNQATGEAPPQANQTEQPSTKAPTDLKSFWPEFQKAIKTSGKEVAKLCHFPLIGGEIMTERFDDKAIDQAEFVQHYDKFFNATLREKILNTAFEKLETKTIEGKNYQSISVFYVERNEDGDSIESAIFLFFGQNQEGTWGLARIEVAG